MSKTLNNQFVEQLVKQIVSKVITSEKFFAVVEAGDKPHYDFIDKAFWTLFNRVLTYELRSLGVLLVVTKWTDGDYIHKYNIKMEPPPDELVANTKDIAEFFKENGFENGGETYKWKKLSTLNGASLKKLVHNDGEKEQALFLTPKAVSEKKTLTNIERICLESRQLILGIRKNHITLWNDISSQAAVQEDHLKRLAYYCIDRLLCLALAVVYSDKTITRDALANAFLLELIWTKNDAGQSILKTRSWLRNYQADFLLKEFDAHPHKDEIKTFIEEQIHQPLNRKGLLKVFSPDYAYESTKFFSTSAILSGEKQFVDDWSRAYAERDKYLKDKYEQHEKEVEEEIRKSPQLYFETKVIYIPDYKTYLASLDEFGENRFLVAVRLKQEFSFLPQAILDESLNILARNLKEVFFEDKLQTVELEYLQDTDHKNLDLKFKRFLQDLELYLKGPQSTPASKREEQLATTTLIHLKEFKDTYQEKQKMRDLEHRNNMMRGLSHHLKNINMSMRTHWENYSTSGTGDKKYLYPLYFNVLSNLLARKYSQYNTHKFKESTQKTVPLNQFFKSIIFQTFLWFEDDFMEDSYTEEFLKYASDYLSKLDEKIQPDRTRTNWEPFIVNSEIFQKLESILNHHYKTQFVLLEGININITDNSYCLNYLIQIFSEIVSNFLAHSRDADENKELAMPVLSFSLFPNVEKDHSYLVIASSKNPVEQFDPLWLKDKMTVTNFYKERSIKGIGLQVIEDYLRQINIDFFVLKEKNGFLSLLRLNDSVIFCEGAI